MSTASWIAFPAIKGLLARVSERLKPPGGICCDRSSRLGDPFDWRILGRRESVRQFEAALPIRCEYSTSIQPSKQSRLPPKSRSRLQPTQAQDPNILSFGYI